MPSVIERTPPAPPLIWRQPFHVRAAWSVLRFVWGCRVELSCVLALAVAYLVLADVAGDGWAVAGVAVITCAVVAPPRPRRTLSALLYRSGLRRTWERSCRHARLVTVNDRIPRITRITSVPCGEDLTVRMPAGLQIERDLVVEVERLAAGLGLMEARVTRDPANARMASVRLVRRDPLLVRGPDGRSAPAPWPLRDAARLSVWEPVLLGFDEDGLPVVTSLVERNLLIGGEPGSGKSVCLSLLLATAALDPECDLYLVDANRVNLAPWAACACGFVGNDLAAAVDLLTTLKAEVDRRFDHMAAKGSKKITRDDPYRLTVVVMDELAFFTAAPRTEPKERKELRGEFNDLLQDIAQRGRAAGVVLILATQRPAGDIIPTSIRDLIGYRLAFRAPTRDAVDVILGKGSAARGADSSLIPGFARGVGWLIADGADPIRLKTFILTDAQIDAIAARAATLRAATLRARHTTHTQGADDAGVQDQKGGEPPTATAA